MTAYIVRGLVLTHDGRIANTVTTRFDGQLSLTADSYAVAAAYDHVADVLRQNSGDIVAVTSIVEVAP